MRQASRLRAFPYILIAAVLAVALPFNSFAADVVPLSTDRLYDIWGSLSGWNYFRYANSNYIGSYKTYYAYNSASWPQDYNGVTVVGRLSPVLTPFTRSENLAVRIPFMLSDVSFMEFDIYYGLWGEDSDGYKYNYTSSVSVYYPTLYNNSVVEIPSTYVDNRQLYPFSDNSSIGSSGSSGLFSYLGRLHFSTNFRDGSTNNVNYLYLSFHVPVIENDELDYYFFCGMADTGSITTPDGSSGAIISGLDGLQGSIDNLVSDMQQSNGQILDDLGNVVFYLENNAVASAESIKILEDGTAKQEELTQLGNALSNVPKPNVSTVTNVMNPTQALSQASSQSVQNALAIVYSWDKLLAILGLVVAVGSASYILFGKKG